MTPLKDIINLIKKTGDKAIVLDETGVPGYVIMAVSDYERLVLGKSGVAGLTEDELLAKINREIAIWKDTQKIQEIPVDQYDFSQDLGEFNDFEPLEDFDDDESNDEDHYYFEPVE